MEAQCKASKGSCEGYSLPRICLLQMPPFRKSRTCVRYKTSLSCMYAKKIREFSDDRLLSEKLPIFFKNRKMNNLCRKSEFLSNIWRKLQIALPEHEKIFRKSCGNCRKNRRFFHEIPVCIKFFLIFTCNFVHNVLY